MSTHLHDERLTTWHSLYRVLVLHFVFETRNLERTPKHDLRGTYFGLLSRSDLKDLHHHRSTQTFSLARTTKVIPDAIRQRSSLIQVAYIHQRRFKSTCIASAPTSHHWPALCIGKQWLFSRSNATTRCFQHMVLLERIYYLHTPADSLHAKSNQGTVTLHFICKEQRAHCLPAPTWMWLLHVTQMYQPLPA